MEKTLLDTDSNDAVSFIANYYNCLGVLSRQMVPGMLIPFLQ